ncbi:MAG: ATP-binding protein, partial [Pseudomonadota bacterium]
ELESVPFRLDQFLETLATITTANARNKPLEVLFRVAEDIPPVLIGDALRLQQVLLNLLGNAIKFTQQGEVALTVESLTTDVDANAVCLSFSVSDTGIGIDPVSQQHIFDPFSQADSSTTRRFGGTGLGLAICQRLVGLMDGELRVASEPGRGSTFTFSASFERGLEVPAVALHPALPMARDGGTTSAGTPLAGLSLLLVEDNEINQMVMQSILEGAGAKVEIAGNGRVAIDRLRVASSGFDAVLMDVQMPEMDGYEATRAIRGPLGLLALPVIAMTANALPADRERARQAGMNAHVAKPINVTELFAVLSDLPSIMPQRAPEKATTGTPPLPFPVIAGIDIPTVAQRLNGNTRLFTLLLDRLVTEFSTAASQTRADLDAGHRESALQRLHTFRGVAGNLAALRVAKLTGALEIAIRAEQHDDTTNLLADLTSALDELVSAIHLHQASEKTVMAAPPETICKPDASRYEALLKALDRHDMVVLDMLPEFLPWYQGRFGSAAVKQLGRAIDRLDYSQAAQLFRARNEDL